MAAQILPKAGEVIARSRIARVGGCKLNDVDPLAYPTDVLARIVDGHPNSEIDQLLPWAYRPQDLRAVA